jgi:cholest-4-en-3-one 26-monooxygenase
VRAEDIDIWDPDVYASGVPHDQFAWLRKNAPVWRQAVPESGDYWAVTRHADVIRVERDPATFSCAAMGTQLEDPTPEQLPLIRTMMLNMDPPEHGRYRRLVLHGFTPRMVSDMESEIRAATREILDGVVMGEEVDFATVAADLPARVICRLMGVPQTDRHRIAGWSETLIGFDDPEICAGPEAALAEAAELYSYGWELAGERLGKPTDDLLGVLANAEVDGERLSDLEFRGLFVQMTVAGYETTKTLLCGGLVALIDNPGQWRLMLDDSARVPGAVEEMLRWWSPLHCFRRTATRDVELGGSRIAAGDRVALIFSSANRDEAVFAGSDDFDIERSEPDRHLAFGHGHHFCLGAGLARLEARVFFEELCERVETVQSAGRILRLRSNQTNGIKSMPVVLIGR